MSWRDLVSSTMPARRGASRRSDYTAMDATRNCVFPADGSLAGLAAGGKQALDNSLERSGVSGIYPSSIQR